jgi:hypothetical protein
MRKFRIESAEYIAHLEIKTLLEANLKYLPIWSYTRILHLRVLHVSIANTERTKKEIETSNNFI